MPGLSHTEILGFAENVERAVEEEVEALRKMGVDPEKLRELVRKLRDRAANLNATQESLKRQTVATTAEYATTLAELYVVSSGALDTLLAAVGKNTDAAKNLRQIRSRIRRRHRPGDAVHEDTPPPPGPSPPP